MAKRGRRPDPKTSETADAAIARTRARDIVRRIADDHRAELEKIRHAADVWTELAEPLAEGRRQFERGVAKPLHDDGIFEAEVHEELIAPVEARRARELEAEDRDAVRNGDYRTAETPREEPAEAPPKSDTPLDLVRDDQRKTANIFFGLGLFSAVTMGSIAAIHVSKERLARRVQAEFVRSECTIVESRDEPGEGGSLDHHVAFERVVDGHRFVSERYSPDVVHGPGAHWMPVGRKVECFYDPKDPATMFLYRGQDKGREELAWRYVFAFPLLFVVMGLMMRYSKRGLR